ncbi:MAG: hypothetical protein IPP46_00455 [Bacteroidetes bacterium]|nr:hypothetical protein [Bacteroidota bacterium]
MYPNYGDDGNAWSILGQDNQREFIELEFLNPVPINFIDIFETYSTGSIDTVYVKNPYTSLYQAVYTNTAGALPDIARKLHISFPLTAFPVSEVRIAINSPAVLDWNELDAVAIGSTIPATYDTYLWSDGSSNSTLNASLIGDYTVSVTEGGCTGVSEVFSITNPAVSAGPSFNWITCTGNTVTFSASPGFSSYLWSNSELTQGISVNPSSTTTYTVTVTDDAGCTYSDDVTLSFYAPFDLSNLAINPASCSGVNDGSVNANYFMGGELQGGSPEGPNDLFTLTGPNGYDVGNNSGIFINLEPGNYTLSVLFNDCLTDTSFTISTTPLPDATIIASSVLCPDGGEVIFTTVTTGDYSYLWSPGNETNDSLTVTTAGTYGVTVTNNANNTCFSSASFTLVMEVNPCIIPYYTPPPGGEVPNIIGSELTQLPTDSTIADTVTTNNTVYLLDSTKVLIEVIANIGYYDSLFALLQTPPYGMSDFIDNGDTTFIITGLIPIMNLTKLDSLPSLINYVRPNYPAVSSLDLQELAINTGLTASLGDKSMRSDTARLAWNVFGEGVKIGVISDSYNTKFGRPCQCGC